MERFKNVTLFIAFLTGLSYIMVSCATVSSTRYNAKLPKYGTFTNEAKTNEAIIRLKDSKGEFFCSAFVIDDNYAATAAHCLERDFNSIFHSFLPEDIIVSDYLGNDTKIRARAAAINTRMDYGLVKGNFKNFNHLDLDLRLEGVYKQPMLVSCGYPLNQKGLYCVPVYPVRNSYFHIAARGMIYPGMSGGPVIDPKTNKVIAVNSAVSEDTVLLAPIIGLLSSFGVE